MSDEGCMECCYALSMKSRESACEAEPCDRCTACGRCVLCGHRRLADADKERDYWDSRAKISLHAAKEAIGPDPEAWEARHGHEIFNAAGGSFFVGSHLKAEIDRLGFGIQHWTEEQRKNLWILDLGCGAGRVAIPLAKRGFNVVGVDISPSMLDHAQDYARREGLLNCRFSLSEGGRGLPVELSYALGAAYSLLTFQHLPNAASTSYIEQIGARLLPGGTLVFQTLEGTGGDFLWNEMTEAFARDACEKAELEVKQITRVKANTADDVTVLWVYAQKPGRL